MKRVDYAFLVMILVFLMVAAAYKAIHAPPKAAATAPLADEATLPTRDACVPVGERAYRCTFLIPSDGRKVVLSWER